MKKFLFINLVTAIFFVIILKISGPCIVIQNYRDYGSFGWPKMYGIEFYDVEISWQVLLNIMIALMIVYLITLIKMLFTIFKLKKLSLEMSKNQRILIFLGLIVIIESVTITAFEREENAFVGDHYEYQPEDYKSIAVNEYNKGYVILKRFNGETTRMKASPKAIEFMINRAIIEKRHICVYYRSNILPRTEYKIFGVELTSSGAALPQPSYYMSGFRPGKERGHASPYHEKIYMKYYVKYRQKIERELQR